MNTEINNKLIAEAYKDTWSDQIRFSYTDSEKQMKMTMSQFEALCNRRKYTTVIDGHSSDVIKVYEEQRKIICDECNNHAMYDSQKDSYYCPLCE